MPEASDGSDVPSDDPPGDPVLRSARRARTRIDRVSASIVRRLNLAGLLLVAAVLCTADFLSVGNVFWAGVLTGLEAALAIPWGWTVVRMDHAESRVLDSKRLGRFRRLAFHAATIAAIAVVLFNKVLVVHAAATAPQGGFGPMVGAYRTYVVYVFALMLVGLVGRGSRVARFLGSLADHPARLMAISFAIVALFGGFLLTLPVSVRHWSDANFVDGLFTSTSAVCVTGLVVNDVSSTYTAFGQAVIFALIQAGGLGIMVLTASVAILAGRKLRTRSRAALAEMIDSESFAALRRTLRHIFVFTVAFEVAGALCLLAAFATRPEVGLGPESGDPAAGAGSVVWSAVFHSVSAFCNAGFSLSHGNLVSFAGSPAVNLVVGALVVVGGLGFPVLNELWDRWRSRGRGPTARLSLHSRVVLATTAALIVAGTVAILTIEWDRSLAHLPAGDRIVAAVFQSVSTRTAGFNTIDVGAMRPAALLFVCVLMFIGASPGSTGGGIKTTTFAVLISAFRAEMRGAALPRAFDRALPETTVRKAASVALGGTVLVGFVWFVLLITESHAPLELLFETVSAFATCGLSVGITGDLSTAGRLVITLLMFVGRIGPVTLALAAVARPRVEHFGVPQERVLIG